MMRTVRDSRYHADKSESEMALFLATPDQIQEVRPGRAVFQSRVEPGEPASTYVLHAFVDLDREPPEVVTVYRTSRIGKYWGRASMQVIYDGEADTLPIILGDAPVVESDEDREHHPRLSRHGQFGLARDTRRLTPREAANPDRVPDDPRQYIVVSARGVPGARRATCGACPPRSLPP